VQVSWAATGLSGLHSLTAKASTDDGLSTTSAATVVTVVSPPPTVAITAPIAGKTVAGQITVTVGGQTDPSQADYPTSITVYDGVNSIGSTGCQGQPTCQTSFQWNATGLTGPHVLTARITTYNEVTATSAPVAVTIASPPPTVAITSPKPGSPLKTKIRVSVSGQTDPSQVDYPISISVYDGTTPIGSVNCQGQQKCAGSVIWDASEARGAQVLKATILTHNEVSASSKAVRIGGSPPKRSVSMTCHLATFTAKVKHNDPGFCAVVGAPAGAPASIRFKTPSGSWSTAVTGHVLASGRFVFTLKGKVPASYDLWVLVDATSKSHTATKHLGLLRIVRG
jgi:hypothetical protein